MCLYIRKKRRRDKMPEVAEHHHHRYGLEAIKKLVHLSTIISPTQHGHHKPPVPDSEDAERSAEKYPNTSFVLTEGTRKHLHQLYKELCGRSYSLSRDKFADFLTTLQREKVLALEREKYKFGEFLEAWSFQYQWDAISPLVEEKDLKKTLANYFISSSHNTYLLGNQLSSQASTDAYRNVLSKDCRCIEIDVWNRPPKSGSRTPTRSRSPHKEHKRHLSSTSVATTVQEGLEAVTNLIAGRIVPSRNPSSSEPALASNPARGSANSLDPNAVSERLGRPLSRTRAWSNPRSSSATPGPNPTEEPIVMHAHNLLKNDWTLGTWVGFRDVCKAVRESAFKTNPHPIIVSLEVHADPDQQEVMVKIMKEEWEELLLDEAIQGLDPRLRLPTLGDLQRKILIKVKKSPSKTTVPNGTSNSLGVSLAAFGENSSSLSDEERAKAKKVRICESLSRLAIYTHSEHFHGLDDRNAKTPSHIFSLDENDISQLHQTQHRELFKHNRAYFMRAYPSAIHMDSSNLDPSKCWRKGVQMVALNWQRLDEAMMLNHAMFADQSGWVLKPSGYRSTDNSSCQGETGRHTPLDLKITVLAGQHIPIPAMRQRSTTGSSVGSRGYPDFRPCVKCELHVEKHAERCEELTEAIKVKEDLLKQKTTPRASDNPDWGLKGVTMEFKALPKMVEELSFVRFRIEDENTKFYHDIAKQALGRNYNLAGWACIRLDRLRQGYRFINILDPQGRQTDGKLLVKIEKKLR